VAKTIIQLKDRLGNPLKEIAVNSSDTKFNFAVHKSISGSGYTLTHIPSGAAVAHLKAKKSALELLQTLVDNVPGFVKAETFDEAWVYGSQVTPYIKEYTQKEKAKKKRVKRLMEEKDMQIMLREAGFMNKGKYYGKSGFYYVHPKADSRAITIGRNYLMLNKYDVGDGKWFLHKDFVKSKVSPEMMQEFIKWAKSGPSRADIREDQRY
jgi:hypothetical protein